MWRLTCFARLLSYFCPLVFLESVMKTFANMLKSFWYEEEGLELSEYALMGALVIIVGSAAVVTLGNNINAVLAAVAALIAVP